MNKRIPKRDRQHWQGRTLLLAACLLAGCANTAVSTPEKAAAPTVQQGASAQPATTTGAAPGPSDQGKARSQNSNQTEQSTRATPRQPSTIPAAPPREIDATALKNYLAARQARHENDVTRAAEFYGEALKYDPENANLKRRSFLLKLTEGALVEALPMAHEILRERPASLLANLAIAIEAIGKGEFAVADERLKKSQTVSVFKVLTPQIMAWTAAGRGDFDGALKIMDTLKSESTFDAFRIYQSAMILAYGKKWPQAQAMLDTWPKNIRKDVRTELLRIAIQARIDPAGDQKMTSELRILTRRYGGENIIGSYLSGDFDLLKEYPVTSAQHGVAEVLYGAAASRSQDRSRQPALLFVNLALYLRPQFDVANALQAEVFEVNDQLDEAIAAYRGISDTSPYHWEAQLRIAWALNQTGKTKQAAAVLNRMAKQNPRKINALVTHGDILRGRKIYDQAARKYTIAIDRLNGQYLARHWSLFYSRGIAYERLKQWPKAEKDLSYALKLLPDQPQVLNYLGYSWADQGKHLEKAISMIKRAVELRPADGYIVDSLGWVYFQLERYPEAVIQLERAIELQPEDPVINDHLGDAYAKVGRRLESCYQWGRVLTLNPEDSDRKKAAAKLKFGPAGKAGKRTDRRRKKAYCPEI